MSAELTLRQITVKEYYQMAKAGILKPNEKVELIQGKIINMSPIGSIHASIVSRLSHFFSDSAHRRFLTRIQNPIQIGDNSEPEPDLCLVRMRDDHYSERHPGPEDVYLLIEVAATTLRYDREIKLPLYASAGIPEVWIVNIEDKLFEVYREPHQEIYQATSRVSSGQKLSVLSFPEVVIDVGNFML